MMASEWMRSIARQTGGWMSRAMNLLATAPTECAVCGKSATMSGRERDVAPFGYPPMPILAQALCKNCQGDIPWMACIYCPVCGRGERCGDCERRRERSFIINRSAVAYNSEMKDWLALYKYRGHERLAPILGEMLLPACQLLARHAACRYWDAITYVPISSERAEERGFNQAEELAQSIAVHYGMKAEPLLVRRRHAGKMSFKSRAERLRETDSLFEALVNPGRRLYNNALKQRRKMNLLLIDDIYTTGSTVESCAKALQRGCGDTANIFVATWARS